MEAERIEALTEILRGIGVKATYEQIEKIAEDYALHLEMEREISSYQYTGRAENCGECERLKRQISKLENEITKYQNSVKKRRGADRVWLEGDAVKYE